MLRVLREGMEGIHEFAGFFLAFNAVWGFVDEDHKDIIIDFDIVEFHDSDEFHYGDSKIRVLAIRKERR